MYHNIEKRRIITDRPNIKYRGWDASGRFYYVSKGGVRGKLWWAALRDEDGDYVFGATLKEISGKLAAIKRVR